MKTIATYRNLEEAYLDRSRLEASGLRPFIPDEISGGKFDGVGSIRLQVQDEDYDDARTLLGLRTHLKGDLVCPHCGSHNAKLRELSVIAALRVFFGSSRPLRARTADCLDCSRSFEFKGS